MRAPEARRSAACVSHPSASACMKRSMRLVVQKGHRELVCMSSRPWLVYRRTVACRPPRAPWQDAQRRWRPSLTASRRACGHWSAAALSLMPLLAGRLHAVVSVMRQRCATPMHCVSMPGSYQALGCIGGVLRRARASRVRKELPPTATSGSPADTGPPAPRGAGGGRGGGAAARQGAAPGARAAPRAPGGLGPALLYRPGQGARRARPAACTSWQCRAAWLVPPP